MPPERPNGRLQLGTECSGGERAPGEARAMKTSLRFAASVLGATLALNACGGQSGSLPSLFGSSNNGPVDSSVRNAAPGSPLTSIPRLSGDLRFTDEGRRAPNAPVRIGITLRYSHQAELDKLVAELNAPGLSGHRHFLTRKEFEDRFAPTRAQEERVVRELKRAGFTIVKRFPNRTIIDAIGRTSTVERFFSTDIHTVHQGKYGERYTNVKAATVPAAIAGLVRDVSLNDLVVVRTVASQSGGVTPRTAPRLQTDSQGRPVIPLGGVSPQDSNGNLVNGNFASGSLSPGWINESTNGNTVTVTTAQAYQSTYSAFMGKLSPLKSTVGPHLPKK